MFIDQYYEGDLLVDSDLCIVGAGPASIALAKEFMDENIKVVILESGNLETTTESDELNSYVESGIKTSMDIARMRAFGGATGHWEGLCAPLDDIDFQTRPWIKDSGWPIKKEDLRSYYKRASRLLDISGNSSDDFEPLSDVLFKDSSFRYGVWRQSHNLVWRDVFYDEFNSSENISIFLNTVATNITLNNYNNGVKEIEATTLSHKKFKVRAKCYVLAAGGIENARLLLLSRDKIELGVGNQNGVVGRYFMQHPHNEVGNLHIFGQLGNFEYFREHVGKIIIIPDKPADIRPNKNKPPTMYNIVPSADHQKKLEILNSSIAISRVREDFKSDSKLLNIYGSALGASIKNLTLAALYIRAEQSPNPDSRVLLTSSQKDKFGLELPKINWQLSKLDWDSIRKFVLSFSSAVSREGLGVVHLEHWLHDKYFWPPKLFDGCHHIGTTRMSKSINNGVVDSNCKVHGINNLYIAGSSVFPTSGWANPTYTIVALSLRLADHLRKENNWSGSHAP